MATSKGLFGRTLTGKARENYRKRADVRRRKREERKEAYSHRRENLAQSQAEALGDPT